MTRAYHETSGPIHELPRRVYTCRRKAIVLGDDGGSVMQPHVPDRLDPRRPLITRAHSPESAVDSISAQFSSSGRQESARKGSSSMGVVGPGYFTPVPSRVGTDV